MLMIMKKIMKKLEKHKVEEVMDTVEEAVMDMVEEVVMGMDMITHLSMAVICRKNIWTRRTNIIQQKLMKQLMNWSIKKRHQALLVI